MLFPLHFIDFALQKVYSVFSVLFETTLSEERLFNLVFIMLRNIWNLFCICADSKEKRTEKTTKNLSVFFATLCIIDLFGVFPIVALPEAIISCGLYGIPLVVFVIIVQIYTGVILGKCWVIAEKMEPGIVEKNR